MLTLQKIYHVWGLSIKYVSKIFRKTNISNPLIRGFEMLVFRKILLTYLIDDPLESKRLNLSSYHDHHHLKPF